MLLIWYPFDVDVFTYVFRLLNRHDLVDQYNIVDPCVLERLQKAIRRAKEVDTDEEVGHMISYQVTWPHTRSRYFIAAYMILYLSHHLTLGHMISHQGTWSDICDHMTSHQVTLISPDHMISYNMFLYQITLMENEK